MQTVVQHKCAFSYTLIQEQFRCENAQAITRREGPDACCTSATAHVQCSELLQRMRQAALPSFGVTDDPQRMPQQASKLHLHEHAMGHSLWVVGDPETWQSSLPHAL